MASLPLFFDQQFLTDTGSLAANHLLYTYDSGTKNPKPTYADAGGATQNANPVVLNSAGRANLWLAAGPYSFELKTPAGVLVRRYDGVDSAQSAVNALATELADSTHADKGASLCGYSDNVAALDAATVANKLWHLRYNTYPSVADDLSVGEIAAIQAGTSTLCLSDRIQALINTGKPFRLIPGGRHRCTKALNWKPGAIMIGSFGAVLSGSGGTNGATVLEFDQAVPGGTSEGIILNWEPDTHCHSWGIAGVAIQTVDWADGRKAFVALSVKNAGKGAYNFFLRDVSMSGARYGIHQDGNLFSGELTNVHVMHCYKAWHWASGNTTSMEVGFLKCSDCFHGIEWGNACYSRIDVYFDHCGLSVPFLKDMSATEMPILQKFTACAGITGVVGQEESNAIFMWAQAYSSIDQEVHYHSAPANVWQKDATRVANIAESAQALIRVHNASYKVRGMTFSAATAGYPVASGSDPSYFIRAVAGSDYPRITLENCFLNLPLYCVAPAADLEYIHAPDCVNAKTIFGATSVATLRNQFGIEKGRLRVGATLSQDYHQIERVAPFVEGAEALRIIPATNASSIRFFAVNDRSPSTQIAGMKISAAKSNGRSINAGGTVNAGGLDYAEYMTKAGDFALAKGAIVGITADGRLTNAFADAIKFMVKSTDPSLVGGDRWSTHLQEPSDDATQAERDAYQSSREQARQRVDRIAFAGQVPVNVLGAAPGDYIVPVAEGAGIAGVPVSTPSLTQYMAAVGQVIAIEDDGRARIVVKAV